MSGALRVTGLTVAYPGKPPHTAVKGVDLEVPAAGSVAIVGPSGCGKSSLLMAIAGVIASSGRVELGGRDVTNVAPHKRDIGLVFQDGQLFPHLSVAGNVAFGLEMKSWPKPLRKERVAQMLALVDLEGLGERGVGELSGGQRQRVALARTLAPSPTVVLLDEPLSSLDTELRGRLAVEVRSVLERSGASWIVVTHDLDEASAMADRTLTMENGTLLT